MKTSTAITTAGATIATGMLAYVIYFDHMRRNDTAFRKKRRKDNKKVEKSEAQLEADDATATTPATERSRATLLSLRRETLPLSLQEEGYFVTQVTLGEQTDAQADHTDMNASSGELIERIIEERSGPLTNGSSTPVSPKSAASFSELDPFPFLACGCGEEHNDFSLEAQTPDQADGPVRHIELGRQSRNSSASAGTDASLSGTSSVRRSPLSATSDLSPRSRNSSPIREVAVLGRPFLLLLFTVLEYPPFNEVIHWDKETETTVVLEQPEVLESYILMPVFGIPTLSTFKRRLYMSGFDIISEHSLGEHPGPLSPAWVHFTMTKSNPPMEFARRGWSGEAHLAEDIDEDSASSSPTQTTDWMLVVDDFVSKCGELIHAGEQSLGPPSVDDQPRWGSRGSSRSSSISERHVPHDGNNPSRRALGMPSINGRSRRSSRASSRSSLILEGRVSRGSGIGRKVLSSPSVNDLSRRGSRASSRTSSISEGHVSPDDDGPSKKVLHDVN